MRLGFFLKAALAANKIIEAMRLKSAEAEEVLPTRSLGFAFISNGRP